MIAEVADDDKNLDGEIVLYLKISTLSSNTIYSLNLYLFPMFTNKICVCVYLTFYIVFWEIIFYPIEMQQILPIETFLLDKTFQLIFFRKMTSGIMVRSQSFLLY